MNLAVGEDLLLGALTLAMAGNLGRRGRQRRDRAERDGGQSGGEGCWMPGSAGRAHDGDACRNRGVRARFDRTLARIVAPGSPVFRWGQFLTITVVPTPTRL